MTATTIRVQMAQRKDTAANWTAANPILLSGEIGYETDTKKFKIGNGSTNWNSLAYLPIPDGSGNLTITGNLEIGSTGSLTFEGSTADGFETTLAVTNPTADRTITMPNQSGVVLVSGNASIVDADIAANAEIAVSKLADGTARQLLQTDAAGTGVEWTSNVDIPGTLDVTGAATFDATVTVAGDLTVNGTTTTISTQNLLVEDKNIIIGDVASPTDVTADGGGITLKGATDKTINWVDATDAWTSSERFSVPLGSASTPSLTFTGDPNTGIYSPDADQVAISTNSVGRVFVDSTGKVSVGTGTSLGSTFTSIGGIATAANDATATYEVTRGSTDANPPRIFINKARGTYTSQTLVSSGDGCGEIIFRGHDGTGLKNTAAIVAAVDGTPGSGSMPGRLVLSTTPSGSTTAVERLRITSAGLVGVGTSSPGARVHSDWNSGSQFRASNGSATFDILNDSTNSLLISSGPMFYRTGTSGPHIFQYNNGSNEALRIDSSGRLLVGTSTSTTGVAFASQIQSNAFYAYSASLFSADNIGSHTWFLKSRNSTVNQHTAVQSGDVLGRINFAGSDGDEFIHAALIQAVVDNGAVGTAVSNNECPSALVFSTTADGASSPTERMRIDSNGNVTIQNEGDFYLASADNTVEEKNLISWRIEDGSEGARISAFREAISNAPHSILFSTRTSGGSVTEKVRIDSSGRLLVGTSSSLGTIPKNIESASNIAISTYVNNAFGYELTFNKSRGSTNGTIVQNGDNIGNISWRADDGTDTDTVAAQISANVDGTPGTNDMPGRLVFSTTADGASSPTERMRIGNNGDVFFSTTALDPATGCTLRVTSGSTFWTNATAATTNWSHWTFKNGNGAVGTISTSGTATAYNTSSDYRLKENITPVTDGITRLQQLKPSRFNFIADPAKTVDGFIAHEVQDVVPEAIYGEKDAVDDEGNPQYQGIDQSKLVPLLTAALQEAIGEIESLKARVAALEAA